MSFTLGNLGMSFGANNQDLLRRMASQQAGQPSFPASAPMANSTASAVSTVKSVSPSARASTPMNNNAVPSFQVSNSPVKRANAPEEDEEELDELASDPEPEILPVVAPSSSLQVPHPNNAAIPLPVLPSSSQTPQASGSGRRSLTPGNTSVCGACNAVGHRSNNSSCPKYKETKAKRVCGECGEKGHQANSRACPKYEERQRRKSQGPEALASALPSNQQAAEIPNGTTPAPQNPPQPDPAIYSAPAPDLSTLTAPFTSHPAIDSITDPIPASSRIATPPPPDTQLSEDEYSAITEVLSGLLDAQTDDDRMVLQCFGVLPSPEAHAGYYDKVASPRSLRTVQVC